VPIIKTVSDDKSVLSFVRLLDVGGTPFCKDGAAYFVVALNIHLIGLGWDLVNGIPCLKYESA